jgi:hypothetical protein
MGDVPLETVSHGGKSTTLEGLKMPKLAGVGTGQVEPETRPEQAGTQLEMMCVNCNGLLSDNNGLIYCRECKPWLVGAHTGRAGRRRTRAVRSQRRK